MVEPKLMTEAEYLNFVKRLQEGNPVKVVGIYTHDKQRPECVTPPEGKDHFRVTYPLHPDIPGGIQLVHPTCVFCERELRYWGMEEGTPKSDG
jgi:hypothetical protein